MATSVEKVTVRFGKSPASTGGNWQSAWAGISDVTRGIGFASVPPSGASSFTPNVVGETGVLMKLPRKTATQGPVCAIAIAPDSPIEAADLHISSGGAANIHRIGVGAPFVGLIAEDSQIRITPIRPVPLLTLTDPDLFADYGVIWDCSVGKDSDIFDGQVDPLVSPLPPLRLNVYRGDIPSVLPHVRAPYSAHVLFNSGSDGLGNPARGAVQLFVIVDGRRRIRVLAGQEDNAAKASTVAVYGIESWSSLIPWSLLPVTGDRRVSLPSVTELLAATALDNTVPRAPQRPTVFDYVPDGGNPYFAILAQIETTDENVRGYLQVHAWDD